MDIFRKVFRSNKNNAEISLEGGAYLKGRNIRIGVLEPSKSNLPMEFCSENLEHLCGPYELFTDIVQENVSNFIFLIGLIKNGTLVHLNPGMENEYGDKTNNDVSQNKLQFSTHNDNNKNKKEENVTFWERLSQPQARKLQEKQTNNVNFSDALILTIDGTFIKQRIVKKNKKLKDLTLVKILDKDSQVKRIPWQYYTLREDQFQNASETQFGCDEVTTQYANEISSQYTTTDDELMSSDLASPYNNNAQTCAALIPQVTMEESCFPDDPNNKFVSNQVRLDKVEESCSQKVCFVDSTNQDSLEKDNCSTSTVTTHHVEASKENTFKIKDTNKTEENFDQNQENIKGLCTKKVSNPTIYIYSETPRLLSTLPDLPDGLCNTENTHEQNMENIYENVEEEKMGEILMSIIRNTNAPISIDIVTKENINNLNDNLINESQQDNETDGQYTENSNVTNNNSQSSLSSIDMNYLDVILDSICSSCENVPCNVSISTDTSSGLNIDSCNIGEPLDVSGPQYDQEIESKSIADKTFTIIEGTEDIAQLADEMSKRSKNNTESITNKLLKLLPKSDCQPRSSKNKTYNQNGKTVNTAQQSELVLPDNITESSDSKSCKESCTQTDLLKCPNDVKDNAEYDLEQGFDCSEVPEKLGNKTFTKEEVNDLNNLNLTQIVQDSEKLVKSVSRSTDLPWWIRLSVPNCRNYSSPRESIKVAEDSRTRRRMAKRSQFSARSADTKPRACSMPILPQVKENTAREVTDFPKVTTNNFHFSERLLRLSEPKTKRSPKCSRLRKS